MYNVPWGLTKADPKYPFKIMGKQVGNPGERVLQPSAVQRRCMQTAL